MRLKLNLKKSIEQNASDYFEKSKKAKKKIETIKKVIEVQKRKLEALKKGFVEEEKKKKKAVAKRKKAWYEKFHWFVSSDDLIVIGGKDATTNELVIKKHAEKNDLVLHTEQPGSPFVVIKGAKKIPESTILEAASFCAVYSKSWRYGTVPDVFYVEPDQVSKKAKPGEYIPKGAFMIYGRKNYIKNFDIRIAIGSSKGQVIGGPITAVQKHAERFVIVAHDSVKKSDLAKEIKKRISGELDEIMIFLPGDGRIVE